MKNIIYLLLPLMVLLSCSYDGGGSNGGLSRIDITDAVALVIAPTGSGSSSNRTLDDANKLYKITEDGYLLEVTYLDEEDNILDTEYYEPLKVFDVDETYVIVSFTVIGPSIKKPVYLVRKSDGAAFSLENAGYPWNYKQLDDSPSYNGDLINTDAFGNIYYTNGPGELLKLDTTNPNNIIKEIYSASGDHVDFFTLDAAGNVAYTGYDSGTYGIFRYRKSSGGFENLPGDFYNPTPTWLGLDGYIYFYNRSISIIQKIIPSPFGYENYGTNELHWDFCFKDILNMTAKDIIIAFTSNHIYELYNSDNEPREIEISTFGLSSIKVGGASDNYYYLAGKSVDYNNVLIKVNPGDNSNSCLMYKEYDIYMMIVTEDDKITFSAARMSDGAKIIGEIDGNTGIITIIDETLNELISLERIQ